MSQNISIWGASYSDVPAVLLPKTGGGTAQFDDTTISTNAATASDILSGKQAYVNGSLITGTGSGGSSTKTATATVSNSWYVEFDVTNPGDWKVAEVERTSTEDTTSGLRNLVVSKALDVAGCSSVNNSGTASRIVWGAGICIDTEPSAMSIQQKVLTRANSIVVFRSAGNANYTTGKTYKLTLYY